MQFAPLDFRLLNNFNGSRVKCVHTQITYRDFLYNLRETGVIFILELL
jgi:hypothetical protein